MIGSAEKMCLSSPMLGSATMKTFTPSGSSHKQWYHCQLSPPRLLEGIWPNAAGLEVQCLAERAVFCLYELKLGG